MTCLTALICTLAYSICHSSLFEFSFWAELGLTSVCLHYLVVIGRTVEDVVSSRVPLDEAHSAAVTLELLPRDCEVLQHAMRRDFPHFHLQTHPKQHHQDLMKYDVLSEIKLSQYT